MANINANEKAFNYLFGEHMNGHGIVTVEQATGLGKSTGAEDAIVNIIDNHPDCLIIYLTPQSKLREQFFKDLSAKTINKNRIIDDMSNTDRILKLIHDTCCNPKTKKMNYKRFDNWLSQINQKDYAESIAKLRKISEQQRLIERLKSAAIPSKLQNSYNLQQALDDSVNELNRIISHEVGKLFKKAYPKKKRENKPVPLDKKLEFLHQPENKWILQVYPDLDLTDKSVLIMTDRKFIYPHHYPLIGTCHYQDEPQLANRKVALLIDESDNAKLDWLSTLIDIDLNSRDKNYLDPINTVRWLFRNLDKHNAVVDREILRFCRNKEHLEILRKKLGNFFKAHHLEANIRLSDALQEKLESIFLFGNGSSALIGSDSKHYFIYYDERQHMNIIDDINNIPYRKKAVYNVGALVRQAIGLIRFFAGRTQQMTIGKYGVYNSKQHLKIIDSLLGISSLDDDLYHTASVIVDYYLTRGSDPAMNQQTAEDDSDDTVYNHGYDLVIFNSNKQVSNNISIRNYRLRISPEKLLAQLANQWLVVLISATANNPSVLSNFDLDWVRQKVYGSRKPLVLPNNLEQALDKQCEDKNKSIFAKTHINLQFIDDVHIFGMTLQETFASMLKDCGISVPDDQIRRILLEYPLVQPDESDDFTSQMSYCGFDPDMLYINSPDSGDKQTLFCFNRMLKQVYAIINFVQLHQKDPTQCSVLIVRNKSLSDEEKDWFNKTLLRLKLANKDEAIVTGFASADFDKAIESVQDDWANEKLKIIIVSRQTIGRGVNINYELNPNNKTYIDNKSHYVALDGKADNLKTDITGIYIEEPTNMYVSSIKNNDQIMAQREQFIYEQTSLLDSNKTDMTKSELNKDLQDVLCHNQILALKDNDMVKTAAGVNCEQILGRLNRSNYKNKNANVLLDINIAPEFDNSYFANKRTNPLVETILGKSEAQKAQQEYKNHLEPGHQKFIMQRNLCNNFMVYMAGLIQKLSYTTMSNKRKWTHDRAYITQHPLMNKTPNSTQRGFYWHFSKPANQYYYIADNDYSELVTIGATAEEALSHLTPEQRKQVADGELPQPRLLNFDKELQYIFTILKANPELKDKKLIKALDLDFKQKASWLITPMSFNNYYKGAIAEIIGGYKLKEFFKYNDMSGLTGVDFEKFDANLYSNDNKPFYIDWKNYDSRKSRNLNDRENKRKAMGKLNDIEKSQKLSRLSAVFINFYQRDPQLKDAKAINGELLPHTIYEYAYLFDNNGKVNVNLISDLSEVCLEKK